MSVEKSKLNGSGFSQASPLNPLPGLVTDRLVANRLNGASEWPRWGRAE